jgi:4-hydroxyproline epimerase
MLEPRGSDVIVGALMLEPRTTDADLAVIFFNNEGYLGMCGHGTIGLVRTLHHVGRCEYGQGLRIETRSGIVEAHLNQNGSVSVANVPSFRYRKDVSLKLQDGASIVGDIAYGGNWFFIAQSRQPINFKQVHRLTTDACEIMSALDTQRITGRDGARIDHIELWSDSPSADARNFVLCPGLAYDRSPCGTGTSAKLACLAGDGKLQPGEVWKQEGILGSHFLAQYESGPEGTILPTITGTAYITSESTLIFENGDPYANGIR